MLNVVTKKKCITSDKRSYKDMQPLTKYELSMCINDITYGNERQGWYDVMPLPTHHDGCLVWLQGVDIRRDRKDERRGSK